MQIACIEAIDERNVYVSQRELKSEMRVGDLSLQVSAEKSVHACVRCVQN